MEQKQLDLFKVIQLRKRRKTVHSQVKVTLPISPIIYEEYKATKLFPGPSQRRIQHFSTGEKTLSTSSDKKIEIKKEKWQQILDSYISAKAKYENRSKKSSQNISFYKLDRVNKQRYQRLIEKQIAPLRLPRRQTFNNLHTKSVSKTPPRHYFKVKTERYDSPVEKESKQVLKLIQSESNMPHTSEQIEEGNIPTVMNFMTAYFKRKFIRESLLLKRKAKALQNSSVIKSCVINTRK